MGYYEYLPFMLMKLLTCTDSDGIEKPWIDELMKGDAAKVQELSQAGHLTPHKGDNWDEKLFDVAKLPDKSFYYVPWYLKCNAQRFHAWYGQADKRYKTKV